MNERWRRAARKPAMPRSPIAAGPETWEDIPPGTPFEVVKRAPDGAVAATYSATSIVTAAPAPWIALAAVWTHGFVDLDGLRFVPGDHLVEYFSPSDPYNAFVVHAPDGALRGWYANVTYPAALERRDDRLTLTWHDLYVDLVMLPDGRTTIRDEDELADSHLATRDPELHAAILAARDRLIDLAKRRAFPFDDRDRPAAKTE
jgi:predicted RNA-binding protein associated with RNAse of E/G family